MRRWHAHPVLPALLALGDTIELRTNWRVYADEFVMALCDAGWSATCVTFSPANPLPAISTSPGLTAFERKYAASGQALWRCIATKVTVAAKTTRAARADA
jgi:hypothetical protein